MGQEKKIKDFKFLYLKNDYFKIGIREERLRNDILLIKFDDDTTICRMYMNNTHAYVQFPYNKTMLNEIRCNTWTLDNIGRGSGIFLKSKRDGKSFREVLKLYDVNNKGYDYTIHDSRKDTISKEEYEKKRKLYIRKHPLSNTSYAV